MKILTILGSPRKHGNTATVLKQFEDLVAPVHQVERINITDYTINGCLGCNACQGNIDEPGCVQKDDAIAIFNRMLAADAIIYATPLYAWSFSAQMKALIDRHYCLVKWGDYQIAHSLVTGKQVALLVTCAGPVEDNADLIQEMFDRAMAHVRCQVIGKYVVPYCTTPDELGDEGAKVAREMATDIGGVDADSQMLSPAC
jgi:multimeric flavodoxin WrbA